MTVIGTARRAEDRLNDLGVDCDVYNAEVPEHLTIVLRTAEVEQLIARLKAAK